MTRHTQEVPTCPNCGAYVIRTHRCTARPASLAPMPADFRDRVAEAIASGQHANGRTDYLDTLELDLEPFPGPWSSGALEDVRR